jgi:hypothetical protein
MHKSPVLLHLPGPTTLIHTSLQPKSPAVLASCHLSPPSRSICPQVSDFRASGVLESRSLHLRCHEPRFPDSRFTDESISCFTISGINIKRVLFLFNGSTDFPNPEIPPFTFRGFDPPNSWLALGLFQSQNAEMVQLYHASKSLLCVTFHLFIGVSNFEILQVLVLSVQIFHPRTPEMKFNGWIQRLLSTWIYNSGYSPGLVLSKMPRNLRAPL